MSGYSLWLSPPSSSGISSYISTLAKRYNTAEFSSHATLVSDEIVPDYELSELVERIEKAVARWNTLNNDTKSPKAIDLEFTGVRQGDKFFQCIFATLELSPSLLSLHESLLSSFSLAIPNPPTYFPHLSLIYADLTRERKDDILKEIFESPEVKKLKDGRVEILGMKAFETHEILVVRTLGIEIKDWKIEARIPLGE